MMPGPTIKTTVSASGSGSTSLTFGDLKAFVAKGESAGLSDRASVRASTWSDQRDQSSGWSLTAEEGR